LRRIMAWLSAVGDWRAWLTFWLYRNPRRKTTVYCTCEGVIENRMFSGGGMAGFVSGFLYPPPFLEI
jgi:hypothetical protein